MQTRADFVIAPILTTWREAFETWLRLDGRKGSLKPLREKSIQAVLQDLRHFTRFLEQYDPDTQPCAPTVQLVKAYFDWQTNQSAPASYNRRLASLRTLMRWSHSAGLIDYDPSARIPRLEMSKLPPRSRSHKDCKALAQVTKKASHLRKDTDRHHTLGLRDQLIWALLKDAGLRRAEVASVNLEGVDLEHKLLTVTGKGGKVGQIFIVASLRELLERWTKFMPRPVADGQGTPLLVGWNGKRISAGQVARRFEMISQTAGLDVTCHDMRHTFVYDLVESSMQNGSTRQVAVGIACQQARHGDTRITEMYLRPSFEQVEMAMEGMR